MILALATSLVISAHSWYPQECCGEKDCHPIPCEELVQRPDGNYQWEQFTFKREQVRASLDKDCHVCVFRNETPYCAFIQMST